MKKVSLPRDLVGGNPVDWFTDDIDYSTDSCLTKV